MLRETLTDIDRHTQHSSRYTAYTENKMMLRYVSSLIQRTIFAIFYDNNFFVELIKVLAVGYSIYF